MPGQIFKNVLMGLALLLLAACAAEQVVEKFEPPVYPPPPEEARFIYERTLLSSADVQREDVESSWKRALTGEVVTGEGLGKPFGIAVHEGRVYVGDTQKRAVLVFDFPQGKYYEIGANRPGELAKPLGMDHDANGNLYVVDGSARVVQVYDPDGKHLRVLGKPELFSRPSGLAVEPSGKRIFVVDTGGVSSNWHRVMVLDGATGEELYHFAERGAEDGQLNLPRDAVWGPDGLVYVVDGGNFRVQVFSPEGEFVKGFGDVGRRAGQFSRPKGIDVDAQGNLYVVDAAFGNFQVFSASGELLLGVGSRGNRGAPGAFQLPAGIAIDEDGRVYVGDQYFRKIDIFRPAALPIEGGFLGGAVVTVND